MRTTLKLFAVGVLLGMLTVSLQTTAFADEGSCPVDGGDCTDSCFPWGGCSCEMVECLQDACVYTQCSLWCCSSGQCEGGQCAEV